MSEENKNDKLAVSDISSSELTPIEEQKKKEEDAYREWTKLKEPPIPLALAMDFYTLYLNSYSAEEIWRVNGKRFPLGQIVDAKIRYDWEKRKEKQLSALYHDIENKVLRVKNEAICHLSDMLAASHKLWGDKIKLFLQDGDESVLGTLDLSNMKTYRAILGMLDELTKVSPKANKEGVKVDGTVNHIHTVVDPVVKSKVTGDAASDLLKMIEESGVVDDT
jgi:hypothetical protein